MLILIHVDYVSKNKKPKLFNKKQFQSIKIYNLFNFQWFFFIGVAGCTYFFSLIHVVKIGIHILCENKR